MRIKTRAHLQMVIALMIILCAALVVVGVALMYTRPKAAAATTTATTTATTAHVIHDKFAAALAKSDASTKVKMLADLKAQIEDLRRTSLMDELKIASVQVSDAALADKARKDNIDKIQTELRALDAAKATTVEKFSDASPYTGPELAALGA